MGERLVAADASPLTLGLDVTGLAGSLLVAKQRGFIKAVRPALDALAGNGFRLSRVVSATILEQAGEA